MNRFKIFILSGVMTVLWSQFSWAGIIKGVSVVEETRTVIVTVELCENSIDEVNSKSMFQDGIFEIEIYAINDESVSCESEFRISYTIPDCSEYRQVSVLLFAPNGGHDLMVADSAMGISETCDSGSGSSCEGDYNACVACEFICGLMDLYEKLTCLSSCKTEEVCLDEKNTCLVLLGLFVLEEDPVMTIEQVFKELAERTPAPKELVDSAPQIVFLDVVVDCKPERLQLESNGKWVTCFVEFSSEVILDGIGSKSITLNSVLYPDHTVVEENRIVAKFSREEFVENIGSDAVSGAVVLTVAGNLADGTFFTGSDTIQVINPVKKEEKKKEKKIEQVRKNSKK